jgi:hypothetical protein
MPHGISKRASASIAPTQGCFGCLAVEMAKVKRLAEDGLQKTGLEMSVLIKLWGGRQLFVERDRWSRADGFFESRREGQEILLWIGRWHLIYTPASWSARAERVFNDRAASRG